MNGPTQPAIAKSWTNQSVRISIAIHRHRHHHLLPGCSNHCNQRLPCFTRINKHQTLVGKALEWIINWTEQTLKSHCDQSHICCMSPPLLIFVQPMIRLWNMIHVPRFFSYPMPLLPPIPPAPMSNDTFCKLRVLPLCSVHESLSHKHTAVGRVHLQLISLQICTP